MLNGSFRIFISWLKIVRSNDAIKWMAKVASSACVTGANNRRYCFPFNLLEITNLKKLCINLNIKWWKSIDWNKCSLGLQMNNMYFNYAKYGIELLYTITNDQLQRTRWLVLENTLMKWFEHHYDLLLIFNLLTVSHIFIHLSRVLCTFQKFN